MIYHYQSKMLRWLHLSVDQDSGSINLTEVNSVLNKLGKSLGNVTELKVSDLQNNDVLPADVSLWLQFALLTKINKSELKSDKETEITVYDDELLRHLKLKPADKKQENTVVPWIDMTGLKPEKLPLDFTAFDTETTGTDIKSDKIIQISAAKYRNGKLVDTYDSLVNPRRQLLPTITEITGITTDQVLQAKDFIDVAPDFLQFISGETLVGQNIILFDLPLVLRQCRENKLDFGQYTIIDTLPLSRKAFPGRKHYSQEKLDQYLHLSDLIQKKGYVNKNVLHNSLNDSLTTAELYLQDRSALLKEENNILND